MDLLNFHNCDLTHAPRPSKADMYARLKKLHMKMVPNSVAIIVSNPENTRSHDTEYPYRQSSDMLYLNGFPEPESALVMCKLPGKHRHTMIMFVLPKDRQREIWTGIRIGPQGAKDEYLADEAYTNERFEEILRELLLPAQTVYYRFGVNEKFDARFRPIWEPTQKQLANPNDILHEMRLIKSRTEQDLLRHACGISAKAHVEAMKATQPGMTEFQLQSVLEFIFGWHGAAYPAYNSIVACGNNAVVLHYTSNSGTLVDGEMVLIDAACEYMGYASDITRTWPVNGRFSPPQRQIYQLVLDAQLAAIKAVRPGIPLGLIHQTASSVLRRGLKKLGILPPESTAHAESSKAMKSRSGSNDNKDSNTPGENPGALKLTDFFMHGTSHWMGLDVHDVGSYKTADNTRSDKGKGKRRILEPGMVFTVEPGLYFDINDKRVPKQYRGIGVRIEDDVLVTASGCEVLTAGVPKIIAEIESLMAG